MTRAVCLALALCSLALAASAQAQDPVPVGTTAPRLEFKDIRFLPRTLDAFGERRAFVLVFVTTTCPIARRYLPKIDRLAAAYRDRGVQVVVVDVGHDDDIVAMAAFALEHDLAAPIVKDTDGSVTRALGITRSPEVAVLDAKHVLRYRGRIDDQVRFGGVREAPTRADLELALDEVLAGAPVTLAETPVDGCKLGAPPARTPARALTFSADVAPLFQRHCQDCHVDGGSAPFPLVTYDDVTRDGDMISEVVAEGRMPPWFATAGPEAFANHRGLSAAERSTIVEWVAAGMAEGEPLPAAAAAITTSSAWTIGAPDLVVRMPKAIKVPAEGAVPYQYVILPQRFEHDTWVQQLEIVADANPEVLHHCNLFFMIPGRPFDDGQIVAGKVPGSTPLILKDGIAALIPAGALLGLQIHYQPTGKAVESRLSVGIRFPRSTVQKRFRGAVIENRDLSIPPGEPHYALDATHTFDQDVIAGGLFGHMHLRGKDFTFRVTHPDGRAEPLLVVPAYSFDWQMAYEFTTPRRFAKGTRLDCRAHFDNSRWNPYNPDPTRAVAFGLQTTQEMLYCFVYYVLVDEALDLEIDPTTGAPRE